MEKASIVKQVQGNGTWNNYYKFEVSFENGDSGTMFKKSDNPYLSVGEQVKYEIEEKKAGYFTIKVKEKLRTNSETRTDTYKEVNDDRLNFEKKKQLLIIRQSTLKMAIDYYNFFGANKEMEPNDVIEMSEVFSNYVINGNK